ncbi:unnamed protein product, partial [Closterium sp. NIES-54]
ALVPTLTEDELVYLRAQFGYMDVDGDGLIDFNDLKNAMQRVATDAMRESHTIDLLKTLEPARISRMPFMDFCAAALNVFQLEALPNWPERARVAYQTFVRGGKAHVTIDELVKVRPVGQLMAHTWQTRGPADGPHLAGPWAS